MKEVYARRVEQEDHRCWEVSPPYDIGQKFNLILYRKSISMSAIGYLLPSALRGKDPV